MIISKICGGLGNQMFQYAAARSLCLEKNVPLYLDTTWYQNMGNATSRSFELPLFQLPISIATKKDIEQLTKPNSYWIDKVVQRAFRKPIPAPESYIREPHFHYWSEINTVPASCYLDGYWQSPEYFQKNDQIIRKDFQFPKMTDGKNIKYHNAIYGTENSVSLHVRRGDYVADGATNSVHGCCDMAYYNRSISLIKQKVVKPHFFIFSDDPEWVTQNFFFDNMTIVTGNTEQYAFRDMQLMSLCKYHVIANSSFSWWGAWLGSWSGGIVIAPEQWFRKKEINTSDIYPDKWMRI